MQEVYKMKKEDGLLMDGEEYVGGMGTDLSTGVLSENTGHKHRRPIVATIGAEGTNSFTAPGPLASLLTT